MPKSSYEQLKEIIIKAVPEIVRLKFGCRISRKLEGNKWIESTCLTGIYNQNDDNHYLLVYEGGTNKELFLDFEEIKIIGRPITLEDVLKAVGDKLDGLTFYSMRAALGQYVSFVSKEFDVDWQLGQLLSSQSPKTLSNLLKLLK